MADRGLLQLQQWLQGLLMTPGPLPQRLARHAAAWGFSEADVVASGGPATVQRRLGVYAFGYRQRLLECLEADFPALRQFLGESLFAHFAGLYLEEHPSRSFTLFDLGINFADFLARTMPAGAAPYFYIPESLARIERARNEVLRAPGLEEEVGDEWTPERILFEGATLQRARCCRLLELPFEVKDFCLGLLRGESPALPPETPSRLALGRANFRLTIESLKERQYALLQACSEPRPFYPLLQSLGLPAAEVLPWIGHFRKQGFLSLS